ncbi:carotenoid 3,4-desaturase [Natronomonas pharaonis DSM 2160]|uniref:Carotenoid 3,4-desaturase n=1 Tax=Natronomonas pharaonis (strain ATCC 35678 / DSM 2160 / CIP 103997 / JCM 8858 / NBRC 14720 / NCIMB 2260 / Gabara) TaxID=348780 RepID=A0A1U7EZ00_NATPD|nr:phytoene desaturase family protein [Natronomonas pharaonis]CAI50473.1 carotenoid 3,4-desaturase [Natronomonas pharaonis DSM 2160]
MSSTRSVVVVGSGFGGLSAACYLADAGLDVTVLEKNEQLGGRASVLETEGFRFDMGPSWYLMPDVFERFFDHFDREPGDFYKLERLDPHYRIFWKDGDTAAVTDDREEMRKLFEEYESGAGEALDSYLATSRDHYEFGMETFVYEDRPRLRDWVALDVMRAAPVGLKLLGTMDDYVADYFDDPKLRQIMQYSLVFLGGAPNNTPAIYNMMSHVDFNLGVYYPENGLRSVVDACVELGEELGVEYVTDAEVTEIVNRKDGFTVESSAGDFDADRVVSNADYAHTEQELLPEHERQYDAEYWDSRTYSPSAFLLYLGVEGDVEPLEHHTLVLPTDWDGHFEQIFDTPAWPDDPAYYLCVPSKTDDSVAPEGHSNLFALVPVAPGLDDDAETRAWYRDLVLDDIAENTGVDLHDRIVFEETFTVSEFADRYNSTQGTALGLAHTLRQTALLRPPHRSDACPGLYFTGAFTTPGIGVPMCLISGEHTAEALLNDAR